MALMDPYRRRYKEGQTVAIPSPIGEILDGKVVEVSELATPSRQNPKVMVKRLTVVATFHFEVPVESPGMLPFRIVLQPEEVEAGDHAKTDKKPQLVTES